MEFSDDVFLSSFNTRLCYVVLLQNQNVCLLIFTCSAGKSIERDQGSRQPLETLRGIQD